MMENSKYEEIVRFWGTDNLKRWSASSLESANIPVSSKEYLQQVGLPCSADWTVRFDPDANDLPILPRHPTYRRIGFDGTVPLCLDESHQGRVICVEDMNVNPGHRLVNLTVEAFGQCLTLYQRYRQLVVKCPEGKVDALIDDAEEEIRKRDKVSFGDMNSYWPVILEQMRAGHL